MDYIKDNLTSTHDRSSQRAHILSLPQAFDDEKILYYGKEACIKENIVIVEDGRGVEWVRGRDNMRYRVMVTFSDILGPFPGLNSGREQDADR